MDKLMHIVDRNRPMHEQWEEVDKMIWAPLLERERKLRMKKKRKFLQENARKMKEFWGEEYVFVLGNRFQYFFSLAKEVTKVQKETHCTVEQAVTSILGTSSDMRYEDLPKDILENSQDFHEVIYFDFRCLLILFISSLRLKRRLTGRILSQNTLSGERQSLSRP